MDQPPGQNEKGKWGSLPQTPYEALGVSPEATKEKIKAAWKLKNRQHHPDLNPDNKQEATEWTQVINEAKSVLLDPLFKTTHFRGFNAQSASSSEENEEFIRQQRRDQQRKRQAEEERLRREQQREAEARAQRAAEEAKVRRETEARRAAEEERLRQETGKQYKGAEGDGSKNEERGTEEDANEKQRKEKQQREEAERIRKENNERLRREARARKQAEEERIRREQQKREEAERIRQEAEARTPAGKISRMTRRDAGIEKVMNETLIAGEERNMQVRAEARKKLLKDLEEIGFKGFIADQMSDEIFYFLYHKGKEEATINDMYYGLGIYADFIKESDGVSFYEPKKIEGVVLLSSNGFILVLESGQVGTKNESYKLMNPQGVEQAAGLNYKEGEKLLISRAGQYNNANLGEFKRTDYANFIETGQPPENKTLAEAIWEVGGQIHELNNADALSEEVIEEAKEFNKLASERLATEEDEDHIPFVFNWSGATSNRKEKALVAEQRQKVYQNFSDGREQNNNEESEPALNGEVAEEFPESRIQAIKIEFLKKMLRNALRKEEMAIENVIVRDDEILVKLSKGKTEIRLVLGNQPEGIRVKGLKIDTSQNHPLVRALAGFFVNENAEKQKINDSLKELGKTRIKNGIIEVII